MRLSSLTIKNLRSLVDKDVKLVDGFNLIVGNNGVGKTSIIESIYLVCKGKSLLTTQIKGLINFNAAYLSVKASIELSGVMSELFLSYDGKSRYITENKEEIKLQELVGAYPLVTVVPGDLQLIKGEPELRRRFLDRGLLDAAPQSLTPYLEYSSALKNKRALLRKEAVSLSALAAWHDLMIASAGQFWHLKLELVDEINAELNALFQSLRDNSSSARADSVARLQAEVVLITDYDKASDSNFLEEILQEEHTRSRVLFGPHRDRLQISFRSHDSREFASQGESKFTLIMVNLAVARVIAKRRAINPLIMLDDMLGELDKNRKQLLIDTISQLSNQVIFTTADDLSLVELGGANVINL